MVNNNLQCTKNVLINHSFAWLVHCDTLNELGLLLLNDYIRLCCKPNTGRFSLQSAFIF